MSIPAKALVLAGGKGTRLRPLTHTMAKQLVPVANRPILFYALDALYETGIRDFGIIISPETGESIREAFSQWGFENAESKQVAVTFIEQGAPKGLAHAVQVAQPYIGDSPFVMYLGDNLIQGNLRPQWEAFHQDGSPDAVEASILLKAVDNPSSFGVAQLDANGQVIKLIEKPKEPPSNLALVGVYWFRASIFEAIAQIKPSWRGELEITDAIQQLLDMGRSVNASIYDSWWLDTGKKDDLLAANQTVLKAYCKTSICGEVDNASTILGAVEIGTGSKVINSTITGPVRIGANCILTDSTIGPHVSLASECQLTQISIAESVVMSNATLSHWQHPIQQSVIGNHCVLNGQAQESVYTSVMLGDDCQLVRQ